MAVPLALWKHPDPATRSAAREALPWQLAAAAVVIVHGVLHGGVLLIGALQAQLVAQGAPGIAWSHVVLSLSRYLNLGAGFGEWGLLVGAALVAWRKGRYPISLPRAFGGP